MVGGVSAVGFRPGFGRGGITHSFCVKIEGVGLRLDFGMGTLFAVEDAEGARICGEAADAGDDAFEADMFV